MGNFYQKSGSGRKRFGGDDRRDGERPQMHQAKCDQCGDSCEVPFRPSGDKPVYCNSCFGKDDRRGGGRSNDRGSFGRNEDRPSFRAVCDECGKNCEVPFRPSGNKPVYCRDCFGGNERNDRRGPGAPKSSEQNTAQFEQLNAKLDEVIKLLGDIIKPKKIVELIKADKEEVKKEKPVAKKEKEESKKEKKAVKKEKPAAK